MKDKGKVGNKIYTCLIVIISIIDVLIIGFGIAVWIGASQQGLFSAADFTNLFTTFTIVRNGDSEKLYDFGIMAEYQKEILNGKTIEGGILPILYPPIFSLVLAPMAFMSLSSAFYLWTIIQLGFLVWIIYRLNQIFIGWDNIERQLLTLSLLAFWPLAITLLIGQISLVILLCLCELYIGIKKYKYLKAGLFLALLMIKPQTILIPMMMLLNKRYWRIILAATIISTFFILFSSQFMGINSWLQYLKLMPTMSRYFGEYGFYPALQYTFRGLLSNILSYSDGKLINLFSNIVFCVVLFIVWFINKSGIPAESTWFNINFSLAVVLTAFFSIHLYPHDDLILILPASILYDYLRQKGYPKKAFSIFILTWPIIFLFTAFTNFSLFGFIRLPIIAIITLLVWIVYIMIMDSRVARKNTETLSLLA